MKAMLFAAGIGSRLKELTTHTPKCLMQIGTGTILEHVIERLKDVGVTSVVINVHHHARQVIEFVESKRRFGLEIVFSEEPSLLDTGGGLKKVKSLFEGERAFLIHNSDIYSNADLEALLALHGAKRNVATLAVIKRPTDRGLFVSASSELVGWTGETAAPPPGSTLLDFSGISVASPEIFAHMPDESVFSLIKPYLAAARATHRVSAALIDAQEWTDIGTPEELAALQKKLARPGGA